VSAFLVGGVLLLVSGIFILRCILWIACGEGSLGMGTVVSAEDLRSGRLGFVLATLGFCLLIEPLGFTLTTFLFIFASTSILSKFRRVPFNALVSAVIALVGWAVFELAFDTRFPEGVFETTMEALIDG
jgi:hypothetical protein